MIVASIQEYDEDEPLASINIIPFVDIVLVLLIIFMLTSAAIVKASLKVDLPKAAQGGSKVDSTINLLLNIEGELFINGEKVESIGEGETIIATLVGKIRETQAVIAADQGVAYGRVIELIEMVKKNGVGTFALDIERKSPPITGKVPVR